MAVVTGYPKEVFKGVQASEDKSQRKYTRVFEVLFDGWVGTAASYEGAFLAKRAQGVGTGVSIPVRGAGYPYPISGPDLAATVVDINAVPIDDSPHFFLVTVLYETKVSGQVTADDNPLLRPPEYSTGSERIQIPFSTADYLGQKTRLANGTVATILLPTPLLNQNVEASCGLLFNPLPEDDLSILAITVTKNEVDDLGRHLQKKATYENKTNSALMNVVYGTAGSLITFAISPGLAKMGDISGTRQFENDIYFLRVSYQLFLDPRGFRKEILDEHVYQIDPITKGTIPCKDKEGGQAVEAMPLDGVGHQLLRSTPPANNDIVQVFRIYQTSQGSVDFGPLGLFP